jgi:hypothetical protein
MKCEYLERIGSSDKDFYLSKLKNLNSNDFDDETENDDDDVAEIDEDSDAESIDLVTNEIFLEFFSYFLNLSCIVSIWRYFLFLKFFSFW